MKIAIAMPAYNEADSLPLFIAELRGCFADNHLTVVIVDDYSKDGTRDALTSQSPVPIVHRNATNLGHGPSYLKALKVASSLEVDFILATDGDGQVSAQDLLNLVSSLQTSEGRCAVGARVHREEPVFRRLVSATSNLLVFLKTGQFFPDSNSPHRAFTSDFLKSYLDGFLGSETIPNILGTVNLLRSSEVIKVVPVKFRDRLGANKVGTSWGRGGLYQLPSHRFIKFCINATVELIRR